jgi:phosphoribosylamine--glycine ligase
VADVVALARRERPDLVLSGPEGPLVEGLADALAAVGIPCLGPGREAARLEGSKGFARAFMARHGVPSPAFEVVTDLHAARRFLDAHPTALVVKCDGLAAGKGVAVCDSPEEALAAAEAMLRGRFGDAGQRVVLEERLRGPEVSFHVLASGARFKVLGSAQDHKRLLDGDQGPNTGGMGAYAPVPLVTPALEREILASVVRPTLQGMIDEGTPFQGILFVGLMLVDGRPKVLEYNARFGDPECAVLLARLGPGLSRALLDAARGDLDDAPLLQSSGAALGVVLAAEGYPDKPLQGAALPGLSTPPPEGVRVHPAGVRRDPSGRLVAAGGRVLLVVGTGPDITVARQRAYEHLPAVAFPGCRYRTDIGWQALTGM